MLDTKCIRDGVNASEHLEQLLVNDLHPIIWRHEHDDPHAADLRDYVVGAAGSIRANLTSAAVHLEEYRRTRYAQDNAIKIGTTHDGQIPHDEHTRERDARMVASDQAFFTALGAALDCTAAVCIAVSGLKMDVQKADMPALLPTRDDAAFPIAGRSDPLKRGMRGATDSVKELQRQVLGGINGSLLAAGPSGWLRWMLDVRNTAVHRERPMNFSYVHVTRRQGIEVIRYMRRHPRLSNLQAIRNASAGMHDLLLTEDALTTMTGCLTSTSRFISGISAVIDKAWNDRRITLDVRIAADTQWNAPLQSTFDGFAPESAPRMAEGTELHISPMEAARFRAGRVLDHDRMRQPARE